MCASSFCRCDAHPLASWLLAAQVGCGARCVTHAWRRGQGVHARVVGNFSKSLTAWAELRDSNEFGQTHHPRWAAKVGMNGPFSTSARSKGAPPLFPSAGSFARFWTSDSYALVGPTPYPDPDLWANNREWFWPGRDDSDNRTFGQLCWHNASLVQFVTANIKQLLRANPNASVVMVAQEDNGKYCNDSAAQRIMREEGTPGGPLFRAVNQIAQAIEPEFPGVMVQTLAYQWSRFAPRHARPRKNVIIELCDIEANFGAPLSDPSNVGFQQVISGWSALTDNSEDGKLHAVQVADGVARWTFSAANNIHGSPAIR